MRFVYRQSRDVAINNALRIADAVKIGLLLTSVRQVCREGSRPRGPLVPPKDLETDRPLIERSAVLREGLDGVALVDDGFHVITPPATSARTFTKLALQALRPHVRA